MPGPSFSNAEIEYAIEAAGLQSETLDEDALSDRTARLVGSGDVVGWFQGGMEWGPRALGNRSVIADPRKAETKDVLNARIKPREPFRPFAPAVLAEATGDFFDQTYPDSFMLKVYGIRVEKRGRFRRSPTSMAQIGCRLWSAR